MIFGLDMAREPIRQADKVVIVEGYMDVIAAHQHGFTNVVACMGTSLTSDQLQQLHRFTSNFVLALDADAAGQQATIRGLNQARQSLQRVQKPTVTSTGQVRLTERIGANLSIVSMPAGLDPDDVIRRTPDQWQTLVDKAQPLVDFYLRFVATQYDLQSAQGKGQAVAELAPLIAELDDEIERQHYIQQLSRQVQIDELTIASRVQAAAKTSQLPVEGRGRKGVSRFGAVQHRQGAEQSGKETGGAPQPAPLPERGGKTSSKRAISQEDHLLANLLRAPDLLVWLVGAAERLEIVPLQVSDLQTVQNQEIYKTIHHYMQGDELWDWEAFQEMLTSHLHGHLAALLSYSAQLPACSEAELRWDTISTLILLRIQHLRNEARNIQFLQDDAARQGDMGAAKQYAELNNQQIRDLFHLQQSQHALGRILGSTAAAAAATAKRGNAASS